MKKTGKLLAALITALSLAMPVNVWADTKISSISLKIDSSIEAGDSSNDVEVTTSSRYCSVDDVEVTNEPSDEWKNGARPKIKVTLSSDGDAYFGTGINKSDISVSGNDANVTSVSRSGKYELTVSLTLEKLERDSSDYDLDVTGLNWDDYDGTASWEEPEDAKRYEVRLYRDGSSISSAISTTDTSYNFASYFTRSGDYTFKVRAIYNSSNKGDWEESDELSVSSSEARDIRDNGRSSGNTPSNSVNDDGGPGDTNSSQGAWLKNDVGWWYCNADRSYPVNQWQYINNYWYFFNASGYMVTGWVQWNNVWYYCCDSGEMLTNTRTPDGYYVDENGVWDGNTSTVAAAEKNLGPGVDKGWEPIDKGWKFKQEDGTYLTNAWRQDSNGKWYYLNEDGWMLKDTNTSDGYHVGADGVYDGLAVTEDTAAAES